jgi:TorA maturation chaperone TorD
MEKPLAALREDLVRLGLQRDEQVPESEDHISALCEVMRYLIASDDALHANLATQKQFFADHLQPWVVQMCDAILAYPQAGFYAAVAQLAKSFFEVEMQAFDMA